MTYTMALVQKQSGIKDCGLFAIAFATNLAFTQNVMTTPPLFDQKKLRPHFITCLEANCFSEFPQL